MGKNAKDKRDIYYRLAKQKNYRCRSAFKLLQINEFFKIFENLGTEDLVVDLCSSPGGWSQVSIENIKEKKDEYKYVIAIDVQKMSYIEGVEFIQGDITNQTTLELLKEYKGERTIKIVICDGAPDITGFTEFDLYVQSQLVYSALNFTLRTLSEGGIFITKIYKGKNLFSILSTFKLFFEDISIAKPKACRNASYESFLICKGFCLKKFNAFKSIFIEKKENKDYDKLSFFKDTILDLNQFKSTDLLFFNSYYSIINIDKDTEYDFNNINEDDDINLKNLGIELIQVGEDDFDSDMSYDLETTGYNNFISPQQMPIDPPYKVYCEKIKGKIIK